MDFSFAWEHRLSQPYLDDWICIQFFLTCCRDFGFRAMEATNVHPSRISEFGTLDQSLGFRVEDTNCLNLSYIQKHAYFYSKIWCFIVFWQSERCESSGSKDKSDQKVVCSNCVQIA